MVVEMRCCSRCGLAVESAQAFWFREELLCEQCCLIHRTRPARKTHWQYIQSITADYLRPTKNGERT